MSLQIFVYQHAMCQFLRKLDIRPDAVIGNSLGEISAAGTKYVKTPAVIHEFARLVEAGALSYEHGLQFVISRAKILSPRQDSPAGMAAVAASAATISDCIRGLQLVDRVVIAVFSGPANHVVSGDLDAISILISHLKKTRIRATLLNVDQGKRRKMESK
jgi:acyl transferase domain-containing protein